MAISDVEISAVRLVLLYSPDGTNDYGSRGGGLNDGVGIGG